MKLNIENETGKIPDEFQQLEIGVDWGNTPKFEGESSELVTH